MSKKSDKNEMIDLSSNDISIDNEAVNEETKAPLVFRELKPEDAVMEVPIGNLGDLKSCLRNEVITVRHIPKEGGMVTNPKHILYGGMANNAVRVFTMPRLSSGLFVNVLTNDEKIYLERIMGLETNALSIYKKVNNFWENVQVRLTKEDSYLDLSNPEKYIQYKVLLANTNMIAPSMTVLQDRPKATYQFVLISEGSEISKNKLDMNATMASYVEFGKINDDIDTLRMIIETIDGRPIAPKTSLDFLQTKANNLIKANSKMFLKVAKDTLLPTKVFIKKAIDAGIIANRGNFLYLIKDNRPLCDTGQDPTLNVAAMYLNKAKNQDLKFSISANLNI